MSFEAESERWQLLCQAQDDFVAALLVEKAELQAVTEAISSNQTAELISSLKQEITNLRAQVENTAPPAAPIYIDNQSEDNSLNSSLILLAGDTLFFNDGLLSQGKTGGLSASAQMKWEVSKDIRLQKQQITGQDVEPSTAAQVTVWVFINRPVLISGLIRAQVISSASTFQEFMDAFNSVPQCFMIDIGTNAPEMKMAAVISLIGNIAPRIYIGGIRPEALLEIAPHLAESAAGASLDSHISSKIALINFRETQEDANWLFDSGAGWRVTQFTGAFSTEAMGTNYGWDGISIDSTNPALSSNVLANGRAAPSSNWEQAGGSSRAPRKIKINPNRAFLNQEPQICVFYHIAPGGCTQKDCGRSHNYVMSEGQVKRLEQDVSKSPCRELRKNGVCRYEQSNGSRCMYSHAPPRPSSELPLFRTREGRERRH